jgi:hypothetical protein
MIMIMMMMIIRGWRGEKLFIYNIDYNFVDVLIAVIRVMILTRVKRASRENLKNQNILVFYVDI